MVAYQIVLCLFCTVFSLFSMEKLTPLAQAAMDGDIGAVAQLLDRDEKSLNQISFGLTPLHYAAGNGHASMVHYLIKEGADVNVKAYRGSLPGMTPLHYAAQYGCPTTVQILVNAGADVNAAICGGLWQGAVPLHFAAQNDRCEVVQILARAGAALDAVFVKGPWKGQTPKHLAAAAGHKVVVNFLTGLSACIMPVKNPCRVGMHEVQDTIGAMRAPQREVDSRKTGKDEGSIQLLCNTFNKDKLKTD